MTGNTINFAIDVSGINTGIISATGVINNLNADLQNVERSLQYINSDTSALCKDMNQGFGNVITNIRGTNTAIQGVDAGIQRTNVSIQGLDAELQRTNTRLGQINNSIGANTQATERLTQQNRIYARIHQTIASAIRRDTGQINQNLQTQQTRIDAINDSIHRQTDLHRRNASAWQQILNGGYLQVIPKTMNILIKGFKSLVRGAYEAVAGFEKASVALSAFTGSMESAKAKFWELNALEDKTCQSTDKLANAFVILGKYGLDNSSKALTSYSQIAVAMNKTVEEVANAIGNASQGQFKSLKELGIQAKQEGDQIILTYQGVTTAIGANTGELEKYIQKLSDDNFSGILEEKTKTVEGAMNRMKNAWGTLQTVLFNADTPFGKFFVNSLNEITSFINDAINIIQTPEIQQVFTEVCDTLKDTAQNLLDGLANITDTFLGENCDTWQKRWTEIGETVSTWLNYIERGLVALIGVAEMVGNAIKSAVIDPFKRLSDIPDKLNAAMMQNVKDNPWTFWTPDKLTTIGVSVLGDFYKENAKDLAIGVIKVEESAEETGNKILEIENRLEKARQDREDIKNGYRGPAAPGSYMTWLNQPNAEASAPESKPIGKTGTSGRKGGGRSGRAQEARDTWTPYYQQLKELDMKSKSDLEKLEWEHAKKLQEYQKIIAENTQASEAEKANALLIINTAYQEDRKKIEKEAHDFIRSLDPEEAELMRLEEGYRNKLEQLEQFHEDQLVSEQTFLEKREELRNQFEQDKKDFQKKKDAEKNDFFSKEDLENIKLFQGGMNDLSDAFSNLTEGMSKSSAAYKAMFALQKGFAVASATMNAIVAWTKALSSPEDVSWYQSLANYASAVALTTGIIQQLASVTMHDKGGKINPGEWGIVGEYGPELIQGPASVTSRRETADLARSAMSGGDVIVNLYESNDKAGSVESEDDNDTRIINIFVSDIRRGGEMSDAIQNTFNLKRIGA